MDFTLDHVRLYDVDSLCSPDTTTDLDLLWTGLGSVSKRVCVKTLKTVKNFGTQTLYRLLETEEITLSSSSSCVTLCFEVLV